MADGFVFVILYNPIQNSNFKDFDCKLLFPEFIKNIENYNFLNKKASTK